MSLKPLSAKVVVKVLVKLGFKVMRQRGSHVFLKHSDGRVTEERERFRHRPNFHTERLNSMKELMEESPDFSAREPVYGYMLRSQLWDVGTSESYMACGNSFRMLIGFVLN